MSDHCAASHNINFPTFASSLVYKLEPYTTLEMEAMSKVMKKPGKLLYFGDFFSFFPIATQHMAFSIMTFAIMG